MNNSLSKNKRIGISSSTIKVIAIVAMTLDHIAWLIFDYMISIRGMDSYPAFPDRYSAMAYRTLYIHSFACHIIGRIAFPLFVFLLVEGIHNTKSFIKYLTTILAFAFIAEIPFNLIYARQYFCFDKQNTLFTLVLCMIAVYALNKLNKKWYFAIMIVTVCAVLAHFLNVDYGFKAVVIACIMELLYNKKSIGFSLACAFMAIFNPWELCGLLALPLIILYNGERGIRLKYTFYIYYPVHMAVIYMVWFIFLKC